MAAMAHTRRCLSVVLFLFGTSVYCKDFCPPERLLKPCTCSGDSRVACTGILNTDVLVQVLDKTVNYQFKTFSLYNSSMMYLPAAKIAAKGVSNLNLVNTAMLRLFDETVDDFGIGTIDAVNVTFQRGINWKTFHNLKKLWTLSFTSTEIPALGKDFKDDMTSPDILSFSMFQTHTRKIHPTAFSDLKRMNSIEVSYSHLRTLKRSWFARPTPLFYFAFRGNKLKSLPDDLFSDMPDILVIKLDGNQLKTLPEANVKPLFDQLREINLSDNPIECECNIRWLLKKQERTDEHPWVLKVLGTCESPDERKGKEIASLNYNDFEGC